ncbi:MAG TPA: DUF2911 domain-containing protein [Flavitalea sp.]|nr:DUF2911 domain-containing protein [Flavitalea sp.]
MKKILFLSLVAFTAFTYCTNAQSPRVSAAGKDVKVAYGQPSKRDREIFGKLVPYGQVWRTGANEASEITFAKDVKFGGKKLKAGTYTLFTIPTAKDWTVILNSQTGQFGAFSYEKYKDKDVLQVIVPVKQLSNPVEKLTYRFDTKNNLVIEWDKTQVVVPISR